MGKQNSIVIPAESNHVTIDLERTALLVIDMQNAFASKGGMYDLWGFDTSRIPHVIEHTEKIINIARSK